MKQGWALRSLTIATRCARAAPAQFDMQAIEEFY